MISFCGNDHHIPTSPCRLDANQRSLPNHPVTDLSACQKKTNRQTPTETRETHYIHTPWQPAEVLPTVSTRQSTQLPITDTSRHRLNTGRNKLSPSKLYLTSNLRNKTDKHPARQQSSITTASNQETRPARTPALICIHTKFRSIFH